MKLEIRIGNASEIDFDSVRVSFPDGNAVQYGKVAKGSFSGFKRTSRAYRYAAVHVTAGDQAFSLQPIDYVGEQELVPGRYTYVLRVKGRQLTVDLERVD